MNKHMEDQIERSKQIHKALLDRRPRGPRFAILILIIFAILSLVLAFTIAFLMETTPVMRFNKEASVEYADPGDTIIYTLTYENIGSGDATDVTITDTLSSNVTFVGSDPECENVSGMKYTWNIGTVRGGADGTITLTVKVTSDLDNGAILYNSATLDYSDENGNPYDQITDDAETLI